jgi:hypothetical protein
MAPFNQALPDLDIVVSLPGSYAAPVGLVGNIPGATLTLPPANWNCGANWYYEVRALALRVPNPVGSAASIPRTRLGGYLAIAPLVDSVAPNPLFGSMPGLALSASLALNPISQVALGNEIAAFPDPAYGPTIRVRNDLFVYYAPTAMYYLISLGIAENKDEDWTNLGHA